MQELAAAPFPEETEWVYWHHKEAFQLAEDTYARWVMFAVESGRFRYRILDEEGTAGTGDVVVCPPGARFEREAIQPLSFAFISFTLRADESAALPQGRVRIGDTARLRQNLERLKPASPHDAAAQHAYGAHYAADIWLLCMQEYERRKEISAAPADAAMDAAAAWLREHVDAKAAVSEAAARCGLTPVQFTRRFQRAFGRPPQPFMLSLRMAEARKLLVTTDWTLDRIALACGYENGFSLSRSFVRLTGIRPSSYRALHRL